MSIRPSGLEAAAAARAYVALLKDRAARGDAERRKIVHMLSALVRPMAAIEAAVARGDEDDLADALLAIPGSGKDFDAIEFDPSRYPATAGAFATLVHAKAKFYIDLDPSLRK